MCLHHVFHCWTDVGVTVLVMRAGLGVCGVEGTFRHSCEEVMRVLRANSQTLLTVLQVFRHDPLYVFV